MQTYDVPDRVEAELTLRLTQFFATVTKDNRYGRDKYEELLGLLRQYKLPLGTEKVMKLFFDFHAAGIMDDWQEDLFGDLANHLTGYCPSNKKTDL